VYTLVRGLEAGRHDLQITKRTEAYNGMGQFMGIYVDKGTALSKPPRPRLKVEIIGDSISCGYGNDTTDLLCGDVKPFENNYMTYGAITSRALGAEFHVVAVSGIGMVKNYGSVNATSPDPLPFYYDRVLFRSEMKWDFDSWTPDIVLLHLGTNDYSAQPRPALADFKAAYRKFVDRVRSHYPAAYIFCLAGPMNEGVMAKNVRAAAEDIAATDAKVGFFLFPESELSSLMGCHWHPSAAGHVKMAEMLVPYIRGFISRHRAAG
jgi:lysophospholipase L1-like esterase